MILTSTTKRLATAVLIILAITILFGELGSIPLRFDEAIYAEISKEMVERGEWVTFYAAVRNSIERNAPVPVSATEAAVTLGIIEAARRSFTTGRRIELQ